MVKVGDVEFKESEILNTKYYMYVDSREDLINRVEYLVDSADYGILFIKVDYKNRDKEVGHFIEFNDGSVEKTGVYDDCVEYENQPEMY